MPEFAQSHKGLLLALCAPCLYILLVLFGRRLKRRHGVRLGFLYYLIALSVSVYVPATVLRFPWPFLRHLGGLTIVLSSTVIIAVIDRYIWEIHFKTRHGVTVPKFLTELVRIIILASAVF